MRSLSLVVVALACLARPAFGQDPSELARAVQAGFPADMRHAPADGLSTPEHSCDVAYQSNGSTPLVVAGFANGLVGRVVMTQYRKSPSTGSSVTPLGEINEQALAMSGTTCDVTIADLSDPSNAKTSPLQKVIRVTFDDAQDWYLLWTGTSFVNIGAVIPRADQPPDSAMIRSYPVDADRTGAMQLVGIGAPAVQDADGAQPSTLFRFDGTRYVAVKTIPFWGTFDYQRGLTYVWRNSFAVADPSRPYKLTLLNGTRKGNDRVTSAVVTLNGQVVVGPTALGTAATLTKSVAVASANTIQVSTDGPAGSVLYVMVEPQ